MIINYDIQKINKALKDFYNATGMDMDLLRPDFSPAGILRIQNDSYCKSVQNSEHGGRACRKSDIYLLEKCKKSRKAEMHICHAGLVDVAVPIIYDDTIIGYIIVGRMKPNNDFSLVEEYIKSLGLDTDKIREYYNNIPFYDEDKIESISNIAAMFVKYILLENMLRPDYDETLAKAISYIDNNTNGDLSIKKICKEVNTSKSVLYDKFHANFQCTVSEYIKKKRVERSAGLLRKTDMSIEEISQKVGFSGASYYSKTFKKIMGTTPLKYKKMRSEN